MFILKWNEYLEASRRLNFKYIFEANIGFLQSCLTPQQAKPLWTTYTNRLQTNPLRGVEG
jgi:hypothetical protein